MNQYESEKVEWQEQADVMRQQIEGIHATEQQASLLKEQIAELQKALSDSHLAIYDEKNYYL